MLNDLKLDVALDTAALLILLGVAILGLVSWLKTVKHRASKKSAVYRREPLDEAEVIQAQIRFEEMHANGINFPDAISPMRSFIYWQLMRNWFSDLNAKYRYEPLIERLREDWLAYLDLLPRHARVRWLAGEAESEEQREKWFLDGDVARKQIEVIEDAFAMLVGGDALDKLASVRKGAHDAFDRSGQLPMAPEGFHYVPVSLRPYAEKCVPRLGGDGE